MLLITRKEKDYLESQGLKWEKDLHKTYSGHAKYYLTESIENLAMLQNYQTALLAVE